MHRHLKNNTPVNTEVLCVLYMEWGAECYGQVRGHTTAHQSAVHFRRSMIVTIRHTMAIIVATSE